MNEEKKINGQELEKILEEHSDLIIPEDSSVFYEHESLEKNKKKKKGLLGFFVFMFGVLFLFGIAFSYISEKFGEKTGETKNDPINDFEELKKGRLSGSVSSAMNNSPKNELKEPIAQIEKKREPTKPAHISKGKNFLKDEEILEKYAQAIDPASAGNSSNNARTGRRNFIPGGSNPQGGVFIKKAESISSGKSFDLNNLQIKVKLEFSIRSTSSSTVIASAAEENGTIPKGAKFYGNATGYVNKRTQLSFSKLIIDGSEYSIKGFAISGRDPGIESEVTDISKSNIDSSIKQGVVQTLSNVATKYAGAGGNVSGDAASNTVNPASSELQKQAEANKMTTEYRVPAGTSFYIYLE